MFLTHDVKGGIFVKFMQSGLIVNHSGDPRDWDFFFDQQHAEVNQLGGDAAHKMDTEDGERIRVSQNFQQAEL